MITNRALIKALLKQPLEAEIDIYVSGYDADGVSLSVGNVPVLEQDYGLNELHFVEPPAIKGEIANG